MQPDPTSHLAAAAQARYDRFERVANSDHTNEDLADAAASSAEDVPALLAALAEAQRERDAAVSYAEFADRAGTQLADERDAARAGAERMRPVVEAAAVYIRTPSLDLSRPHPAPREARALIEAVHAYEGEPDTYETQEGTG